MDGNDDARLVEAAVRLVAARPPSEFLAARAAERPPHRHVVTHGVFGTPDAVVCVTEFPPAVEQRNGTVEVRAAGKKITFAEKAAPALVLLLAADPSRSTKRRSVPESTSRGSPTSSSRKSYARS